MSSQKVTQHRSSEPSASTSTSMSIPIGIAIVLLIVFAAKLIDIPVRQDLTGSPSSSIVVEDWKGNSGSIPYRSSLQ